MDGTPMTWIFVAALVVGGVVRAIKADALGAILTKYFRPNGPPIAIPSRALPWIALAFGGVAAVLDAKIAGANWSDAAKAGVISAALAVFGHELGSGVPGLKRVLVVPALLCISLSTSACSMFTREHAKSALDAAQITCVFASDLVEETALADACGIARDLIPIVRNLVGQREAARRSGVRWPGAGQRAPEDAGVPDAAESNASSAEAVAQ